MSTQDQIDASEYRAYLNLIDDLDRYALADGIGLWIDVGMIAMLGADAWHRTGRGILTWEHCPCEVCQHEGVPAGTGYDQALRIVRWYEADADRCPKCGDCTVVYGDWYCPRCTMDADQWDDLWAERERPRREAECLIARWLTDPRFEPFD